jgi:hypothetical protein
VTARCEKTDLLIGECGDSCCRPDLTPRRVRAVNADISMTFTARYDSSCDYCEEGRIREGEQMGLDQARNKVCERCLP